MTSQSVAIDALIAFMRETTRELNQTADELESYLHRLKTRHHFPQKKADSAFNCLRRLTSAERTDLSRDTKSVAANALSPSLPGDDGERAVFAWTARSFFSGGLQ